MTRVPIIRAWRALPGELIVDNFAGGGGASTGIYAAAGRPVDIAINHSPEAIAMHAANHPGTKHFCENILEVDPREACGSRPVGLAWFSPDCTHFSKAKGTAPRSKEIRGLAWVVIRWARAVRPRIIVLENVEEFQTWGPLREDGRPDPSRAGETYRAWLAELAELGYSIEVRTLVAADYGTPTTRRRLFLVARRDGRAAAWPEPTHGAGRAQPWRPAAEVIDWRIPCPSIFERRRPLAEATLRRIAAGIKRYVVEAAAPFIVPVTHQGDARVHGLDEPVRTVTAANRGELALVSPLPGQVPRRPAARPGAERATADRGHVEQVRPRGAVRGAPRPLLDDHRRRPPRGLRRRDLPGPAARGAARHGVRDERQAPGHGLHREALRRPARQRRAARGRLRRARPARHRHRARPQRSRAGLPDQVLRRGERPAPRRGRAPAHGDQQGPLRARDHPRRGVPDRRHRHADAAAA